MKIYRIHNEQGWNAPELLTKKTDAIGIAKIMSFQFQETFIISVYEGNRDKGYKHIDNIWINKNESNPF